MIESLFLAVLLVNAAYCIRTILTDWAAGNRGMAALGVFCVVGVNVLVGLMIYDALVSHGDF